MPNLIERWLLQRVVPAKRNTFGTDATTELLRGLVPYCAACGGALAGHEYRFFASHPAHPSPTTKAFLKAVQEQDWAEVQACQLPAVGEPLFVMYALACPADEALSGAVILLRVEPDPGLRDGVHYQSRLTPEKMAALRALCPACKWIPFGVS